MKKLLFVIILFYYGVHYSFSQTIISGTIKDEQGKPVSSASVTISKKNTSLILAFNITDNAGNYKINLSDNEDSLTLAVSALNYARIEKNIAAVNGNYHFTLTPKPTELKEVQVKSPPVWQRKDTINYNAADFKQVQDRVVGDIIARLPGVEVSPGGQIKYQGKPINKYYIEGLDLLGDKYGIANSNLPAGAVDKIQILENHQPIRILDSIAFSDRAALNIKLKNNAKAKIIGRAKLGIGAAPLLTDDALTNMLFKKNLQFINSYKYNNIGTDNSIEFSSQNFSDFINAMQNGAVKNDVVNLVQASPPPFSPRLYSFNNQHTITFNELIPLKKDFQLRINASYIQDLQKQQTSSVTKFYLPTDTVIIDEAINSREYDRKLQTDITITTNTPKIYLNNLLRFQGSWDHANSIVNNNTVVNQQLKNPYFNLSNEFFLLKTKKKYIQQFKSYIGFVNLPQQLYLQPGLYSTLLNNGNPFDALLQKATKQNVYTNNFFTFIKRKARIGSSYKIGFNVQEQVFNTGLFLETNQLKTAAADSFQNNLRWHKWSVYEENNWTYEGNRWRISFILPINFTNIHYTDAPLNVNETKSGILTNPNLNFNFQATPKLNLTTSFSYNKDFGDMLSVVKGYRLKNYRSISNTDAPLSINNFWSSGFSIQFRNPIKIFFTNLGINYSRSLSNITFRQVFTGDLETLTAYLQNNNSENTQFNWRINKYFYKLKMNVGFNAAYSFGSSRQLQQNTLVNFSNKNYLVSGNATLKVGQKLSIDYTGNYVTYFSSVKSGKTGKPIKSSNQKLSLNIYPATQWIITTSLDYYYISNNITQTTHNFFNDAGLRYKPKKSKIDYELKCINLLNQKSFTNNMLMNNVLSVATFPLRPRQVLFSVNFSLQ
ncbi:MAG: carboxypeptidase-like regulatory domain-containing protein [Bacteroidetes bacterium]|nr:carboxypeptidase-like regulatory domain-containing protein [Bacteroidota bacterium]